MTDRGAGRGVGPLVLLSGVVALVAAGLARGAWWSNLHNGLLGLAFTLVGAYVLYQRPGHREGRLFLAAGLVEAVLFFGRQVGHAPVSVAANWWGWLGVWPVALGLALTTVAVICFPDGRVPSPLWRWVVLVIAVVAAFCAGLSALWPVEYVATDVVTAHPLHLPGAGAASTVWGAMAHPAYGLFQLLWVVAIAVRWRRSGALVRVQLASVALAAAVSAVCLVIGLAVWGAPTIGLLTAALVPVAAGWAIVHGQHLAAYSAISWLSRTRSTEADLSTDLARAAAEALGAARAAVWMGDVGTLHAVGVWPPDSDGYDPSGLEALNARPGLLVRPVVRMGTVIGAIGVERPATDPLSLAESQILDDLTAQAGLVIAHLVLLRETARRHASDDVGELSRREQEVLKLMARGLSNAAIAQELHVSIKTVEPAVGSIFIKLGLPADAGNNRRVLAVLAFIGAQPNSK